MNRAKQISFIEKKLDNMIFRVNYIHNGKSLATLKEYLPTNKISYIDKVELITQLNAQDLTDSYYLDVVKNFNGNRCKKINIEKFENELQKSIAHTDSFKKLNCRGFSYKVHSDIKFGHGKILDDVNFKIALMPDGDIYYPPRIRRYLRRIMINHYKHNGYPSICFSLGKKVNNDCFIFVIQSDIIFKTPSFIRDHFRGWRKVLINTIIQSNIDDCNHIYLPTSEDVVECSISNQKPLETPEIWKVIYDQTAIEFGFKIELLSNPVNIQIYKDLPPVFVKKMYKLKIKNHEI